MFTQEADFLSQPLFSACQDIDGSRLDPEGVATRGLVSGRDPALPGGMKSEQVPTEPIRIQPVTVIVRDSLQIPTELY